jgi:serine/threonine-protein kinase PknG
MERALAWVTSPQARPTKGITLAGHPATVSGVRQGLEAAYRQLAAVTPDDGERVALVDRANAVRPWSIL